MPDDAIAMTHAPSRTGRTLSTIDIMGDVGLFAQYQRAANLLAASELVPKHLQGKQADCFLALCIASEKRQNPVMVTQNIYFVNGTAGWKTQYMIAEANTSGKITGPIRWRVEGTGDAMRVTAYAELARVSGDARIEAEATMAMAKAEGWTNNKKYQSMPQQMLSWRSATMLIRLYMPEILFGLDTADELEDMQYAVPAQRGARPAAPTRESVKARATPKSDTATEVNITDVVDENEQSTADGPQQNEAAEQEQTAATDETQGGTGSVELNLVDQFGEIVGTWTESDARAYLSAVVALWQKVDPGDTLTIGEANENDIAEAVGILGGDPRQTIDGFAMFADAYRKAKGDAKAQAGAAMPDAEKALVVPVPEKNGTRDIGGWFKAVREKLDTMKNIGCVKADYVALKRVNAATIDEYKRSNPSFGPRLVQAIDLAMNEAGA